MILAPDSNCSYRLMLSVVYGHKIQHHIYGLRGWKLQTQRKHNYHTCSKLLQKDAGYIIVSTVVATVNRMFAKNISETTHTHARARTHTHTHIYIYIHINQSDHIELSSRNYAWRMYKAFRNYENNEMELCNLMNE
jgi:hypothetical protein